MREQCGVARGDEPARGGAIATDDWVVESVDAASDRARMRNSSVLFRGTKASVARHAPARRGVLLRVSRGEGEVSARGNASGGGRRTRLTDALVSGACAGLTSLALLYPLDSLLVRQATSDGAAGGLRKGIGGILRREGIAEDCIEASCRGVGGRPRGGDHVRHVRFDAYVVHGEDASTG